MGGVMDSREKELFEEIRDCASSYLDKTVIADKVLADKESKFTSLIKLKKEEERDSEFFSIRRLNAVLGSMCSEIDLYTGNLGLPNEVRNNTANPRYNLGVLNVQINRIDEYVRNITRYLYDPNGFVEKEFIKTPERIKKAAEVIRRYSSVLGGELEELEGLLDELLDRAKSTEEKLSSGNSGNVDNTQIIKNIENFKEEGIPFLKESLPSLRRLTDRFFKKMQSIGPGRER